MIVGMSGAAQDAEDEETAERAHGPESRIDASDGARTA